MCCPSNYNKFSYLLTGVYGCPNYANHKHLWENLKSSNADYNTPWMFMEDFNQILHPHEMVLEDIIPIKLLSLKTFYYSVA